VNTKYNIRTVKVAVIPEGDCLFSERVTLVEIHDESGGEFLRVTQQSMSEDIEKQQILIEEEEWPTLRVAIDQMIGEIKKNKPKETPCEDA
jgi:hypothetical protein